jgi:PAS domain S-box-containing protein
VLSNVPSGILTISYDGTVIAINPAAAALLGRDARTAHGARSLADLAFPPDLRRHLEESLHAESPDRFREIKADIAGSQRTFSVAVSPFLSPGGERLGILAVLSDVTRERELERKLELSSRMAAMGEMVAGVAHQIRNPLGIMKISAEMLRDHLAASGAAEQPRKLVSMIVKEADSLGAVVSNFLDFARPLHVRKEPCRLEEILDRVTGLLPLPRFPGIGLSRRYAENLPEVLLDRNLFEQAFSNLLMNALQASAPGQTVIVETRQEDGRPVVEIRDSGQGMDEETRNRIFSPFFTTKDGGTGLGLSIALRIVESHGGRIAFQSERGRGTAFRVVL